MITYDDELVGQADGEQRRPRRAAVGADRLLGRPRRTPAAASSPTAVALATDHCFGPVGLHRIEVDIRPENDPSQRVVEQARLPRGGLLVRYLDIDGAWRDHVTYALTVEDVPGGLLRRLHEPLR